MHYLQRFRFKKYIFFSVLLLILVNIAEAQDFNSRLSYADSLFSQQEFTESYQVYDSINRLENLSSPQMLLKMAYIKEGLGDYTLALYHLNEYYMLTSDERALAKMEALGQEQDLIGYEYSEADYLISFYHKNYDSIVLVLIVLGVIFLGGMSYQKFKLKEKPTTNYVLLVLSSLALVIVLNTGMGYSQGIITHHNTYIMSGPSSSSEVLAIVAKGNKVPIKNNKDVWIKTEWQDRPAYIKSKNVTPIASW